MYAFFRMATLKIPTTLTGVLVQNKTNRAGVGTSPFCEHTHTFLVTKKQLKLIQSLAFYYYHSKCYANQL